jgi:XRE family transcriptional regulator, regulator of sulfur utilization
MKIGEVINSILKRKGITQIELAKLIGKSPTALSQIINGVYEPNPQTLDKICEALDVPKAIVYFLTISEKDIPEEKLELYKMLAPSIKDFLVKIFGTEQEELID